MLCAEARLMADPLIVKLGFGGGERVAKAWHGTHTVSKINYVIHQTCVYAPSWTEAPPMVV